MGNSFHNVSYFDAAIKEENKMNSFLYCHEISMHNLLLAYLDFSVYKQVMCKVYPELTELITNYNGKAIELIQQIKERVYGIRAVLLLTRIPNIIVNNNKAREMLIKEIKGTSLENMLTVTKLFLPISVEQAKISNNSLLVDIGDIKIGIFGLPDNKMKSTDVIIKAVVILNEIYRIKSKCLLAGYDVDHYIENSPEINKNYLLWFSNISNEHLFSLMEQVDIAVQLRNNPHGESSAVICELLALNKPIITSENFIDDELGKYCIIVKRFISAEELAKKLYELLMKKQSDNYSTQLCKDFSFERLSKSIINL